VTDPNGAAWWSLGQKLGMVNRQSPTVSQMNGKWSKRTRLVQSAELFDRHVRSLTAIRPPLNKLADSQFIQGILA
jgi:hypothetical protein